jgi:hypothetical protein
MEALPLGPRTLWSVWPAWKGSRLFRLARLKGERRVAAGPLGQVRPYW